jgi:hypothetical protein
LSIVREAHMMNDPVAQPLFAVLDVPQRDVQRLRGRPVEHKFDHLGRWSAGWLQ